MTSGVKRSLFNKPAWAAAAAPGPPSETDPSDSIFSRNTVYEDIVQAEQRRREKRLAKAKSRTDASKDKEPELKKRRISIESDDDLEHSSDSDIQSVSSQSSTIKRKNTQENSALEKKALVSPRIDPAHPPVTRSIPRTEKKSNTGLDPSSSSPHASARRPTTRSSALDQEDEDLVELTPPKPKKKPATVQAKPQQLLEEEESEEESEFLKALKAQAREKARLQRLGIEPERPRTPNDASTATTNPDGTPQPTNDSPLRQKRAESSFSTQDYLSATPRETTVSQPPEDDPDVRLYIQSSIPSTAPLIVKRKASQSLKQVREFWCKKNGLDEKTTARVFFTWRETRLFDSTTMRGIIQKLKNDHARATNSFNEDLDDQAVEDPSNGQIMIEAVTLEIFEQRQQDKERRALQRQELGGSDNDEEGDAEDDAEAEAARQAAAREEEKLRNTITLRLVSRDLDPLNLNVRPHTTIGKMMQGYAVKMGLEQGKTAWLVFDGDRLDPDATAEDIGFENHDEIEVHIR